MSLSARAMEGVSSAGRKACLRATAARHGSTADTVKDGKLQVHFEYFRSNVPNQEKLS